MFDMGDYRGSTAGLSALSRDGDAATPRHCSAPAAPTAAAGAYRAAILLRELRGGVHTDAVKAAGLSPVTACQFNRDRDLDNFKMHGFSEEDLVE